MPASTGKSVQEVGENWGREGLEHGRDGEEMEKMGQGKQWTEARKGQYWQQWHMLIPPSPALILQLGSAWICSRCIVDAGLTRLSGLVWVYPAARG